MATSFEDLRILQVAEKMADETWKHVVVWDKFARDVVGGQLARAMDSIGANIAESFGRYHYGDKLLFLYYARGSLFEAKYWLNRTQARGLLLAQEAATMSAKLADLARQLNAFANSLKGQRSDGSAQHKGKRVRESIVDYSVEASEELDGELFSNVDFEWLSNTDIQLTD